MKLVIRTFVVLLVALSFMPLTGENDRAIAGEKANPVKERQKLMRAVGKAMKTTVKMLRGDLAYDAAAASGAMKTMSEVAQNYPKLFPAGSDMENSIMDFDQESDAKPEIWANMDDFKSKTNALLIASTKAGKAAGDKTTLAAVFNEVGKSCKACHQKYKAKKQE